MDMTYKRLPNAKEVRKRIDDMPTDRRFGKIYQNALRYLYLTAGRVSEVTGKYKPKGKDAIKTEIMGNEVVIFPIRTARRRGRIRAVALPLKQEYERWTKTLLDWFEVHDNAPAFGGISMRSIQREAGEVFQGLWWPVEEYQNVIYEEVDKSKIIRDRVRDGTKEYLVEYPNMERRWVEDPRIQVKVETVEEHWRSFSLQSLRQRRIMQLKYYYGFSDEQIRTYTGLTTQDSNIRIYSVLDSFDWGNPSEDALQFLRFTASSYIEKLLKQEE